MPEFQVQRIREGKCSQDGSNVETNAAKPTEISSRGRESRFLNSLLAIDTLLKSLKSRAWSGTSK